MWFSKPDVLTESQLWGLAAGGLLTAHNNEGFEQLRCNSGRRGSRKLLSGSWGVSNARKADEMLRWLYDCGHSENCRDICASYGKEDWKATDIVQFDAFLDSHIARLKEHYIIGWDLSRLIQVARWSYTTGYLKKGAAWDWIMRSAQRIQGEYNSWDEFAEDFCLGFDFWRLSMNFGADFDLNEIKVWLKTSDESPWSRYSFSTELCG